MDVRAVVAGGGRLVLMSLMCALWLDASLAAVLPEGQVNFIAVGSYQSQRGALAMIRSSNGKVWYNSRVLSEFPARSSSAEPRTAVVAFGKNGGPAGEDVWVFGGDTQDASGNFGTLFFSL